jgi:MFS family permease
MSGAQSMICTRCNALRSGGDRCATCGARLQTLSRAKFRGRLALCAGAFLVIFMGSIWIWVDRLFATRGIAQNDPGAAQFLGKINVAFALVVVAGVLGIANGWVMARSGRRNLALIVGLVVAFAAAVFIAAGASNGYRPG